MHKNNPTKRRVTQGDVAKKANVSQAMVSYIVNDNKSVTIPDETRQRVLDVMDELGYFPNITARRLRSSKTYTIAGIIPDITNPFYPAFERGIQDVANRHNYDLVMYNTDGTLEREQKCLRSMLQGRVDGIVSVFFHIHAKQLIPLIDQGLSIVRLEGIPKNIGKLPIDNIYIDNISASQSAVDYLIERGHSRIGMLTSDEGPARFREIGYRKALDTHGITYAKELLSSGEYSEGGGYQAMIRLLSLDNPPSAVFAANDLMAMGAMVAIREANLHIPNDVAIIGFDDIPTSKLVYPALTTVAQFQRNLGQRAAEMLMERLNGNGPEHGRSFEMPYEIIIRDTV